MLAAMMVLLLHPATAHADCSAPSGKRGALMYNDTHNVVQFCDGTHWYALGAAHDARIGGIAANKWCAANAAGDAIACTYDAPAAAPASPSGSVQFNNAGAFGGDAGLTWDNTGKRLGIGTAGPGALLDLFSPSVPVRLRMNPGTTTANAAGILTGFAHHDTVMGVYLGGGLSHGFISTGYANSGRDFSIGTASSSTYTAATFSPVLTVVDNGRVGISTPAPSAALHLPASTTARASLRIANGAAPTAPNDGDVWYDGTHVYMRIGSTSYQLDQQSGGSYVAKTGDTMTGNLVINNASPTIVMQDSDHKNAAIHVNGNVFYILSGNAVNGTSWATNGSYWPLALNMLDDSATFGGNVSILEGALTVSGSATAASLTLNGGALNTGGATSTYGALTIDGAKNGYSGINFKAAGVNQKTLMISNNISGIFNAADNAWDWYWANGTLTAGTVPAANISAGTLPGSFAVSGNLTVAGVVAMSSYTQIAGSPAGAGTHFVCTNGANWYLYISGTACAGWSDIRLKKDIKALPDGTLDLIGKITPVTFNWKDKSRGDGLQIGLVAQDVEKVFPLLVATTESEGGLKDVKSVNYERLAMPIIKAIQELKADNDDLRAIVERQGAAITTLEAAKR